MLKYLLIKVEIALLQPLVSDGSMILCMYGVARIFPCVLGNVRLCFFKEEKLVNKRQPLEYAWCVLFETAIILSFCLGCGLSTPY